MGLVWEMEDADVGRLPFLGFACILLIRAIKFFSRVNRPGIAGGVSSRLALRQLDGTVQRLLVEADGAPVLRLTHCRDELAYLGQVRRARAAISTERVVDLVAQVGKSAAARELGLSRSTVHRRMDDATARGAA